MAPSRRQRLPRRAQSSTPYARDSGFASATQSERQPAPQNPRKRCHISAEVISLHNRPLADTDILAWSKVTQAPSLHETLATSHPDWRPRPLRLTDLEVVKTAGMLVFNYSFMRGSLSGKRRCRRMGCCSHRESNAHLGSSSRTDRCSPRC